MTEPRCHIYLRTMATRRVATLRKALNSQQTIIKRICKIH